MAKIIFRRVNPRISPISRQGDKIRRSARIAQQSSSHAFITEKMTASDVDNFSVAVKKVTLSNDASEEAVRALPIHVEKVFINADSPPQIYKAIPLHVSIAVKGKKPTMISSRLFVEPLKQDRTARVCNMTVSLKPEVNNELEERAAEILASLSTISP